MKISRALVYCARDGWGKRKGSWNGVGGVLEDAWRQQQRGWWDQVEEGAGIVQRGWDHYWDHRGQRDLCQSQGGAALCRLSWTCNCCLGCLRPHQHGKVSLWSFSLLIGCSTYFHTFIHGLFSLLIVCSTYFHTFILRLLCLIIGCSTYFHLGGSHLLCRAWYNDPKVRRRLCLHTGSKRLITQKSRLLPLYEIFSSMSCLQSQLTGIWGTTGFLICVVCISGDNANRFSNKHILI